MHLVVSICLFLSLSELQERPWQEVKGRGRGQRLRSNVWRVAVDIKDSAYTCTHCTQFSHCEIRYQIDLLVLQASQKLIMPHQTMLLLGSVFGYSNCTFSLLFSFSGHLVSSSVMTARDYWEIEIDSFTQRQQWGKKVNRLGFLIS